MKFTAASALALAALIPASVAQTFTKCNPLEKKGCPSMEALGANATFNWNKTGIPSNDKVWLKPNQGKIAWVEKGATFTIERSGDAPQVDSKFYMLFGRLEVIMKTAEGQGIVSTAILQSETLDEIDWEFLGGNNTHVLTNFYGKGNNETLHGEDIRTDKAPQDDFRNYTVDWTKERIQWWLDDKMIREVTPAEAQNGKFYPQTPMNIRIGCWAAGDKDKNSKGTIEWAQGETDFSKGPFTMTVQHVYAQDYTTGAQMYSWDNMDASGTWDKVKVEMGKSEVLKEIQSPSGVRNRWAALPQGAKIGIIAGAAGAFILLLLFIGFCCIKQRRAGKKEHQALLAEEQKEAAELQEYKRQMQSGKFGFGSNTYRV